MTGRVLVFAALLSFLFANGANAADTAQFARTLYLVRHGAYERDAKADPTVGPGLMPLGIAQARLIAARLRGMPVHFDAITSSTMRRAKDTAAVIREALSELSPRASPLIRECTPPSSNERIAKDLAAGEAEECAKQLEQAFHEYFTPAESHARHDLLVCHGNVIRYFVTKALGVDTRAWAGMSVAHASLTVIRVNPDGSMRVLAVGDIGHIPPNMQSGRGEPDPLLVVPP